MATSAQQQQFVSTYGPYATQAGNALGVSPNVILGQWAFESNWGTSNVAQNNGNLAGLGYTGHGYSSYSSPQDFTNGYISFVQNGRYSGALNTGTDSNAFVSGLKQGGYFTGDQGQYQAGVASNVQQINSINPNLSSPNTTQIATSDPTGQGYGSNPAQTGTGEYTVYPVIGADGQPTGSYVSGTQSDPATNYLNPGESLGSPLTYGQGSGSGGTNTGTASNLGTAVGYIPPAATGGPYTAGLAPGVVSDLNSWISGAESAVGNWMTNFATGIFSSVTNWFARIGLIVLAIVLIAIALWRLLDPDGEKTKAAMKHVGTVAAAA